MSPNAQTSTLPAQGPELDNRRVIAGVVDLAVVLAGALVIGFVAGLLDSQSRDPGLALSAVITGWALYYYFACESGGGQTLGKKLLKVRVVRVDGNPASMGEIALRTGLRLVDGLFLYLVGLIVMLVTGERRGRLGDLAAGTKVISADAPAAAARQVQAPVTAPAPVTLPEPEPETEPEPEPASPELKEIARDVAAQPVPVAPADDEDGDEHEDELVVINSAEPVPVMDLVMEEEPKGGRLDST